MTKGYLGPGSLRILNLFGLVEVLLLVSGFVMKVDKKTDEMSVGQ
jgi:hypothetical protein